MIITKAFEESCRLIPSELRHAVGKYTMAEEFRFRCGYRPSVILSGKENEVDGPIITEKHILHITELATGASIHSSANFISSGYINFRGLRIGLCGQAIYKDGQLIGFRNFSSISIRIPHEKKDILPADIYQDLISPIASTLIAAEPGGGKTTALREIVRYISEQGTRISLLDERGELAGAGMAFDLGRCTDILSFVPKAEGAMFMLRSMNPQIIAMDEITKPEDLDAVFDLIGCGIHVIATAHGSNLENMMQRPLYNKLISEKVFDKLITISCENGARKYSLERIK